ncbi:MAG: hypothetical protein QM642_00060 [Edaphocola sp.]
MHKLNKWRVWGMVLAFFTSNPKLRAQVLDTTYFAPIMIDEVIVKSDGKEGFDIGEFIQRIKDDTTFYKAFRSMHLVTYNADNDIKVYDKKGSKPIASLTSETKQICRNGCRTMDVLEQNVTGDFFDRKGNYNYYTAELYASLFFTKGKVCNEDNIVAGKLAEDAGKGSLERNKAKLKQLMFNPGSRIGGIPFMGNKPAIFDPEIAGMYDFKLSVANKNGEDCYLFEATPKKGQEENVVYRQFNTWFRQSDYSIVARDYHLRYNTLAYDFDVAIHVDLQQKGQYLLPVAIDYRGNWYAFSKGRERVDFSAKFYY